MGENRKRSRTVYEQKDICQKQMVSLSNYLGNCEFNDIKKICKKLSEALICKYSLSFSKGGCDSVFWTIFTMEIFILYVLVSVFLTRLWWRIWGTIRKVLWRRAWQPLQYSCLENSMETGACRLQSIELDMTEAT